MKILKIQIRIKAKKKTRLSKPELKLKQKSKDYQNKDKSDVSKRSSSMKSTSLEWNAIVFIVLASDVCLSNENCNLLTLVYVWNLNQSSLSERRLIGSLFSICCTLNADIVLLNELNRIASSSGNAFNCSICWLRLVASALLKYST